MLIHAFVPVSRANGPGRRAVLWFQGCALGCSSCWNQTALPFEGTPTEGQEIVERVLALHQADLIEGLTFSGGEPMQQPQSMLGLIERLHEGGGAELSFGMFTGYTLGELERGHYFTFEECADKTTLWQTIRAHLDFAVMGRYNVNAPVNLPMLTSRNQRLHLFSSRYRESDFDEQMVEISIEDSGAASVSGFPVLGFFP
jgi:anaerobic ribonucleoside-triphosphate reductase activating protein